MKKTLILLFFSAMFLPAMSQQAQFQQCGGIGWTGPTECEYPYTCVYDNAYYSQCLPGAGGGVPSYATSLIAPPGNVVAHFAAGQLVNLKLTNNGTFGTPMTVTPNLLNSSWTTLVLPLYPQTRSFSIFATVPYSWTFTAQTNADAALVALNFTWASFTSSN